jgi:hypothetical protein
LSPGTVMCPRNPAEGSALKGRAGALGVMVRDFLKLSRVIWRAAVRSTAPEQGHAADASEKLFDKVASR